MKRGDRVDFIWGEEVYSGQVTYVSAYSDRVAIAPRGIGHETVMVSVEDIVEDEEGIK